MRGKAEGKARLAGLSTRAARIRVVSHLTRRPTVASLPRRGKKWEIETREFKTDN
jgi:hypothetical protein